MRALGISHKGKHVSSGTLGSGRALIRRICSFSKRTATSLRFSFSISSNAPSVMRSTFGTIPCVYTVIRIRPSVNVGIIRAVRSLEVKCLSSDSLFPNPNPANSQISESRKTRSERLFRREH